MQTEEVTRPEEVTAYKKSATGPFKKSAKLTAARSPDVSPDVGTLRPKAGSDWAGALDPGISWGGKNGKQPVVVLQRLSDVTLVHVSPSLCSYISIIWFYGNNKRWHNGAYNWQLLAE